MNKTHHLTALLLAVSLVGASASWAQIRSSTIVGVVADKTGAVIPDAEVSVINEETTVAVTVKTGSPGQYVVPYLSPGRYTLTVKKEGFSIFSQTGIALAAAQEARVDPQLEIGAVGTIVEVQADAVNLQTESSSVQARVESRMIEALPNMNHNPFYFATLLPGVVARNELLSTTNPQSFGIGYTARTNMSAFSINGAQALMSDIIVDGVSVMGVQYNEAVVLPNSDGIDEVRVMTNNYSAENGRGQGQISITTKSGTNQFHGSAFGRLRNEALNANTLSNNTLGIARPPFKVGYFGGTLGGPILKNKLFFFAGYEGMTHHRAVDWLATVPTTLEKRGNFSQTLVNVNGVPTRTRLFDPFSVTQIGANLYQRAEIPNAIIPRPDPFALNLLGYYPDPNRQPTDVYNSNNYFRRGLQTFRKDDLNTRFDYHVEKHSIYGTGGIHHGSILTPQPWGDDNPFYVRPNIINIPPIVGDKNPYVGIGDTVILSPTLVADLRFGLQRINTRYATPLYPDLDYDSMGIPDSVQNVFVLPGSTPNLITGRWTTLNSTNALHKHSFMTNYHAVGNLTKIIGKWNLKVGAEYRADLFSDPNIYEGSVTFRGGSFSSQFVDAFGNNTAQNTTADIAGLYDSSLLLGGGSLGITPGQSVIPASAAKYMAVYTQNDWRATSRLTINLGLRWDLQPAVTERYNQLSAFDPAPTNAWETPGVVAFPGKDGYSRNMWDTHYRDFGPRLGVAYRVTETMVVRGGYGITYTPSNTGLLPGPFNYGSAPFSIYLQEVPYGTTPHGVPIGTFSDPDVSVPVKRPGADAAAPGNYGYSPQLFQRSDYLNGRVQQWNVFVEKRLRGSWVASVGYSATHGDQLPVTRLPVVSVGLLPQAIDDCYRSGVNCAQQNADLTGRGYIQTGRNPANDPVPNPWNRTGTLPFGGVLAAQTIPRYVRDSQYPLFAGASSSHSVGWSNYHSMVVELKHAFSHGLQLDAHYTWSKALDFTGAEAPLSGASTGIGFDPGARDLKNLKNNYHLAFTDIPHRFVVSMLYELPFGSGKHFGLQQSPVLKGIASGWRIGAAQTLQSGYPIPITGGNNALNARPSIVPGQSFEVPKELQRWYDGKTTVALPDGRQITPCANCFLKYNIDAFASSVIPDPNNPGRFLADAYYVGDAALSYAGIRSPGRNNLDISIARTFQITETYSLEFSANALNALNHTQIAGGGSYGGPGYQGNLGAINLTPNDQTGTKVGQLTNSLSFGTFGLDTYDPRQLELQLKLRF